MAKARCWWLPSFEKREIEGGLLQQILPRPLLLQRRGEQQRCSVCDFPPLKKGGLRGDFYRGGEQQGHSIFMAYQSKT